MNDLLKNIRHNSYKTKNEVVPRSPDNNNKFKDKKSLTICNITNTPKPHGSINNNQQLKIAYSTNTNETKIKLTPKGSGPLKISEKTSEKSKNALSSSQNAINYKKSQSQNKETKPSLISSIKETPQKSRVNLQLCDEDKSYLCSIDVMKTPKNPILTNFVSNYTTPKAGGSTSVTNRFAFSPETDHSKVLNILNPNNNISISIHNLKLYNNQNYQNAKFSSKSLAYVKAYSANTNQGIIRNYNEDRVSIILNIVKPNTFILPYWPKCSFFAVYDGHGGCLCADFLRDNLHNYIIKSPKFPINVKEAIEEGFELAEKEFINNFSLNNQKTELVDKSGSCALISLIVDDVCYMANVGDSRAVISKNGGKDCSPLTVDHKPNDERESKRITENGGKVYQTQTLAKNFNFGTHHNQLLIGPHRVLPGRLSVSRTFGDAEAKLSKFGGNERVIIATPDVFSFKIDGDVDFVALGCDGIFDQLSDQEVAHCVWLSIQENIRGKNIHLQCGVAVDLILKSSLLRKTLDNVTCVLIVFENFEKCYNNNTTNFNFSTINSNLSTSNTLNTPINNNRNFVFENKEEKHSSNKSYLTNASSNTYNSDTQSKTTEDLIQLSVSKEITPDSPKKTNSKDSNQQESPLRIKSSKTGLNLIPPNDLNLGKYLTLGKNEKTIDINLANYVTNSQKGKNPKKNGNVSEEVKNNEQTKFNSKNMKMNETFTKVHSKK